jgi:crotonobetainyl-CoA:carnitine CoA-transferase CaiB-like acyl-CoA transferase
VTAALLVTQRYEYNGTVGDRLAEVGPAPSFIVPCGDGYIGANVLTDAQWRLMCAFFGQPELADDPRLVEASDRMQRGREVVEPVLVEAVRDRAAAEVFHDAQSWRIPFGLVPTVAEAFELLPHQEREFFAAFDHPVAGRVRMPGIPFLIDGARPPSGRPPLLGEHNDELLADSAAPVAPVAATPAAAAARPLAGIRIVDLSMFMSGPLTTLCLADAGADVI